jgi:hypothetical protein
MFIDICGYVWGNKKSNFWVVSVSSSATIIVARFLQKSLRNPIPTHRKKSYNFDALVLPAVQKCQCLDTYI